MAKTIDYPERETQPTDLIAVGASVILGTLIGLAAIDIVCVGGASSPRKWGRSVLMVA